MPCGWEGNRRSGVALAMRHRLQWFIHLRAHGLRKRDEHLAYTPRGVRHSFTFFTLPSVGNFLPANQHALVLRQHKRSKVKYTSITVRTVTLRHRYENSRAIRDHTVLPAIRQSWHSRPYPSRAVTRFSDHRAMLG